MFESTEGQKLIRQVRWVVVVLGVFLAAEAIAGVMNLRYIGAGIPAANTISVSGKGDAFAVPDLGDFTFSVLSDKPTVAAAQADAAGKINAVTAYLKSAGVDEKDIKTVDYSVYPQYDYQNAICPQPMPMSSGGNGASAVYCPPGKQVLKGYEVRQTTEVKVRDTSKAGELLAGVGGKGATEVSGLSFTVEDETAVQNEARDKAIADAKAQANALAKSLGVSLVRIVSFSESGSNPGPIYYGMGASAMDAKAAPAPEISTGQNKVTSNVTITYEIR